MGSPWDLLVHNMSLVCMMPAFALVQVFAPFFLAHTKDGLLFQFFK